ncbi:MAG: glycine cleavage system protein GcvH [Anaerolineales bacterium]|nr:glycine cleavage system protein GcvH [Anaerolineales bacterium]MCB9128598.1 glycine cleavage system protein GcvH [Ardenticatenales bacterium]MCB9172536.1 glycine cleavage system protein GcvH [Ardenticatenales bacterium]
MSTIKDDLRYTKEHEWAMWDEGLVVIGITDYAQETLGDIVYVEVGEVGDSITAGDAFGVVESVKAASDLYAPISGEIVAVNDALFDAPEQVNSDPYGEGWMLKVRPDNEADFDELLDAAAYEALLEA